uniref:EF-hand domain-containing protein n=1 Tax=Lotharella globosa TaxID=91324 RepID=A0A7S3Z607_9EUKA
MAPGGGHRKMDKSALKEIDQPSMETEPTEGPLVETPDEPILLTPEISVEPAKPMKPEKPEAVSVDSKQVMSNMLFGDSPVIMPRTPRLARRAMKDLFNTFTDADSISRSGFKEALRLVGRRPKANNINAVFTSLDSDGNGHIEFDEFANGLSQLSQFRAVKTSIVAGFAQHHRCCG